MIKIISDLFTTLKKKLNESLTVAESGLFNNSNIYVIQIKNNRLTNSNENNNLEDNENKFNYNIIFSYYNRNLNLTCNIDDKLEDAIKKYCEKININFIESFQKDYIFFLYNAYKIHLEDLNKTIGQFFKMAFNPLIVVTDTQNLIGN